MEEKKKSSGLAVAGLVLSIIAIVFAMIPIINVISYFLAILAIIFGIVTLIRDSKKVMSIIVIILSICTFAVATNMNKKAVDVINKSVNENNKELNKISSDLNKSLGNATEDVLKNDVEVNLGTFEAKSLGYGMYDTKLEVTVKNKLSEKKSFSLHIEAVNKNGERIAEDYVSVNDLGGGQSQKFKAFSLVDKDKIKELKNAEFKIIEASAF